MSEILTDLIDQEVTKDIKKDPERAYSDLLSLMTGAWSIMHASQRRQLLNGPDIKALLDDGSSGKFSVAVLNEMHQADIEHKGTRVADAGYFIMNDEDGFYVKRNGSVKTSCGKWQFHEDAIEAAYRDMKTAPAEVMPSIPRKPKF